MDSAAKPDQSVKRTAVLVLSCAVAFPPAVAELRALGLGTFNMHNLSLLIITRFFPGTLEEYHAAREIQRTETKMYRRQPQFILGQICFGLPLLTLAFSGLLPTSGKLLLLPVVFGFVFLRDTLEEHYCLMLLRRSGEAAVPKP